MLASMKPTPTVAQMLLANGADPTVANRLGCTSLHVAAAYGRFEVARVLVKAGGVLDGKNKAGQTPMFVGCEGGHVKVVRHFLSNGGVPSLTSKNGRTTLHAASFGGSVQLCQLLKRASKGHADFKVNRLRHLHLCGPFWTRLSAVHTPHTPC